MHLIVFRIDDERLKQVVARQFDNLQWLEEEPDVPNHEAV